MPVNRRQFLAGMAATPALRGAAASSDRPLDVAMFLDVEDTFNSPSFGNDDSIGELAKIFTEEGLRANFLFMGDRAQLLADRGRKDVIAALQPHDVGLHSPSASHPCVPEYVAGKSWDDALAECLRREKAGAETITRVFGKPCAALSMHWEYGAPQSLRAAALLGLPFVYGYPAAPPLYSLSWYDGAFNIPYNSPTLDGKHITGYFDGFDDRYHDTPLFDEYMPELDKHIDVCRKAGHPYMTLFFFHPQRVRLAEFIDEFWCPNGVNIPRERWGEFGRPKARTPEEVRTILANVRRLARWLRKDPRINNVTITDLAKRWGTQPDAITRAELAEAAQEIVKSDQILLHKRFSPAEIVLGLADAIVANERSGALPASVTRRNVLGPKRSPIWHAERKTASRAQLVKLAQSLLDESQATGHLPATFGGPLERVGVNHLYRGFAEAFLAVHNGGTYSEVRFPRMRPYPELASKLGEKFLHAVEGELIDPDTDMSTVYRDGKLQTWTLKPAIV